MRVLCRFGHFAFFPNDSREVGRFISIFGKELVRAGDFYTFPLLAGLGDFCLVEKPYGGVEAKVSYEGTPWEIMRENSWVYSIADAELVEKTSILSTFKPQLVNYFYIANTPLVQPGSIGPQSLRVDSYDGELDLDAAYTLRIRELQYG